MVARINTGKSISKTLNYNEHKVQKGGAEILFGSGFIETVDRLNFYQKKNVFDKNISLNDAATTNVLHVSLNFDPSEKLSNDKMKAIAKDYMEKIGFGSQPYLVYRHNDSGHPHLHIVSTNIQNDGKRISMHRLGANQSEKARKEIEVDFGLVKADSKRNIYSNNIIPIDAKKVVYGKSEIKRSISNILRTVLNEYKFSSLPELNAVLQLYNVNAERGDTDSRMSKHRGLVYRVLDESGNKVGAPIKASLFYMKPTLKMLEQKFEQNEKLKEPLKGKLQTSVGWVLHQKPESLESFIKALKQEGVNTVLRRGKDDIIYGITYVDIRNKVVFNGSDLGKQYSANAIMGSFHVNAIVVAKKENLEFSKTEITRQLQDDIKDGNWKLGPLMSEARMPYEPIPYSMKIKKKHKRKHYLKF